MNYDQLTRQIRCDELARQRLIQRAARHGCISANDAAEVEELSAKDLAKKILAKLGIRPESDNPVNELMSYFERREAGDRGGVPGNRLVGEGMDSADGGTSSALLDRYLAS